MIDLTLAHIADLTEIVADRTTVAPGELVFAKLGLPIPGDSPSLADKGFTVDVVRWMVTTTQPQVGVPVAELPVGTAFIAPLGLTSQSAAFGLMPPFSGGLQAPNGLSYWLAAEFTLRRAGGLAALALGAPEMTTVTKWSSAINATGLSGADLTRMIISLFKVQVPGVPVTAGAPVTARLRPRGAEDAEWDVDAAEDIAPRLDLDLRVPLGPLFRPLNRILGRVLAPLAVGAELAALGLRLVEPLLKAAGAIDTLTGATSVERDARKLIQRLRLGNLDLLGEVDLPIVGNVLNRNFTKHLVPRNATSPLPGPRGLPPTIPALEDHFDAIDALPAGISALPLVGGLRIPLSLANVSWNLWRIPVRTPNNLLTRGTDYFEVAQTGGRLFSRTFAIEPGAQESLAYLDVTLQCVVDPDGSAINRVVSLPLVPLRLEGFDPMSVVAAQLNLEASPTLVEAGEDLAVQVVSGLDLVSTSANQFEAAVPLGSLPARRLTVAIGWNLLDHNRAPLQPGGDYFSEERGALDRLFRFAALQVMRRERSVPWLRYVSATLTAQAITPPRIPVQNLQPQTLPLVPLSVLPIQMPALVACFERNFFDSGGGDRLRIYVPDHYVTEAPGWVQDWARLREQLATVRDRVSGLLAIAGPAASDSQLVLLRGALDYIVDRADTVELHYASYFYAGAANNGYTYPGRGQNSAGLNQTTTVVVINDGTTEMALRLPNGAAVATVKVSGTPVSPACVLWRENWVGSTRWRFQWIPRSGAPHPWPAGVGIVVTPANLAHKNYLIETVTFRFSPPPAPDARLRQQDYFRRPGSARI